jgi:hypothetical protein
MIPSTLMVLNCFIPSQFQKSAEGFWCMASIKVYFKNTKNLRFIGPEAAILRMKGIQ